MGEIFSNIYDLIITAIENLGVYGPLLGSLFIVLESIIPPLPLFVFITINFISFGHFLGFIISWICTIIGCLISYYLVKRFLRNFVLRKIKNIELLNKCLHYFENLSLTQVTIILAIPFTPAFMMNIAAGIANMDFKKFFASIVISKIFLILFWGFIGTGIVDSFKNPINLVYVLLMVIGAYILSYIIKKLFKLD